MKKLLTIFILGMFLISFASALDDRLENYKSYKQGECIEIKQSCGSCSYVNISSLSYPNSSIALSNVPMTNYGNGGWNYTFCNTNTLGRYDIIGIGDENGVESSFATYFEITRTGYSELTEGEAMVLFIPSIFIIIFSILLFIIALNINETTYKIIMFSSSAVIFFIGILYSMVILDSTIVIRNDLVDGFSTFLMVIKIFLSIGILSLLLYAGYRGFSRWYKYRGFKD